MTPEQEDSRRHSRFVRGLFAGYQDALAGFPGRWTGEEDDAQGYLQGYEIGRKGPEKEIR